MTIVIAEAGTNYADSVTSRRMFKAMHLASTAKYADADYVKYQLFTGDDLFCPLMGDQARSRRWNNCSLMKSEWAEIKDFCRDIGIGFMASAFDFKGVRWLGELNVDYYKVASRAVDTYPYELVPGPFIVSNGMTKKLPQVSNMYVLQCCSQYPTPLAAARWFGVMSDGLSDHSGTIWPAIDAILRDARFVEVHFNVGIDLDSPDRAVCLNEQELAVVCEAKNAASQLLPN